MEIKSICTFCLGHDHVLARAHARAHVLDPSHVLWWACNRHLRSCHRSPGSCLRHPPSCLAIQRQRAFLCVTIWTLRHDLFDPCRACCSWVVLLLWRRLRPDSFRGLFAPLDEKLQRRGYPFLCWIDFAFLSREWLSLRRPALERTFPDRPLPLHLPLLRHLRNQRCPC